MDVNPDIPYEELPFLPPDPGLIQIPALLKQEAAARTALGELKGICHIIPHKEILLNIVALLEAKDSSEIENIITTHDKLFLSLSQSKPVDRDSKEVLSYREALFLGLYLIRENDILRSSDIIEIQKTILKNDAGIRSNPGTRLLNDKTGEAVYTPPQNKQKLLALMDDLARFINEEEASLVNLAVMHYQFESIHPFYDGNGRTGRILMSLYLVLKGLLDSPILYLSRYISQHKSEYYDLLHGVTFHQRWEEWVSFILQGVEESSRSAIRKIEQIKLLMEDFITQIRPQPFYSRELIETLFEYPYTRISNIVEKTGVERKTASRHLQKLEDLGLLEGRRAGKTVYYVNTRLVGLLKEW